jgi:ribonucleotide monophosphatase NagD (HAD superfamily)
LARQPTHTHVTTAKELARPDHEDTVEVKGVKHTMRILVTIFGRLAVTAFALSTSVSAFTVHQSFKELAAKYDAFILDQFGVLHNGVTTLDGVPECIEYLHKQGKKLIILSNTSAPSHAALAKLSKLGLSADRFCGAVTSGEEASKYIRAVYGSDAAAPRRALLFTWDPFTDPGNPRLTVTPEDFLQECGSVEVATSIDDADFVLFHGSEILYRGNSPTLAMPLDFIDSGDLDTIRPILQECIERSLDMVCANPDNVVVKPDSSLAHMPGTIAKAYLDMGGTGKIFGKPQVEHFEACLDQLGLDNDRVAHVGDSLHHDVAGANACGIASVFVTSGIHADALGTSFGEMVDENRLKQLLERESIVPTHVMSAFRL